VETTPGNGKRKRYQKHYSNNLNKKKEIPHVTWTQKIISTQKNRH
jgi:hypothetical protein